MAQRNSDYLSSGKSDKENEIKIGPNFQADIPPLIENEDDLIEPDYNDKLLWKPSEISETVVNNYLKSIKSSQCRRMSEEEALYLLHQCDYDTDEAFRRLQLLPEPVSEEDIWSEEECRHFERVLQYHGKKFRLVTKVVPSKSVQDVVKFYYFWKRSERYDAFINDKCIFGQSKYKKRARRKSNRSMDPADIILDKEQLLNDEKRLIYPIFPLLEVI